MRGSAIASLAALIITGAIIADILTHPKGTKAAGDVVGGLWNSSLATVSGQGSQREQ